MWDSEQLARFWPETLPLLDAALECAAVRVVTPGEVEWVLEDAQRWCHGPPKYLPHQQAAHEERVLTGGASVRWHRRHGKTYFAVRELFDAAEETTGSYAYVTQHHAAMRWLWAGHVQRLSGPGWNLNRSGMLARHANGSRIRFYAGDPRGLMGDAFDGVVLDEARSHLREATATLQYRRGWLITIECAGVRTDHAGSPVGCLVPYRADSDGGWNRL